MTTPIGKFRSVMDKFFTRLESYVDQTLAKDLCKFKTKYELGMKASPRDTVTLFVTSLRPYARQIMEGRDSFFLKELAVEDDYASLGESIRALWPTLGDDVHDYIRNQFKLLLMLGTIAIKDDDLRLIINEYRDPANPLEF